MWFDRGCNVVITKADMGADRVIDVKVEGEGWRVEGCA
jgi:hypothetical protein